MKQGPSTRELARFVFTNAAEMAVLALKRPAKVLN
jgi:hypothetical protein